jgi:hypothetical protein
VDLAVDVAREIAGRSGPLAGRMGALLNGIGRVRRRAYRGLLSDLARMEGLPLRSVAGALARAAFERTWTDYEADLVPSLAASGDATVRGHVLHAVAAGSVLPPLALAVLTTVSVGDDLWLGEKFADAADVVLERSGDTVDRATAAGLLRQLAGVPRFSETDAVTRFLTKVGSRWPDVLMDFVILRVRRIDAANRLDSIEAEEEARPRALYRAVPRGDWSQVWAAVRASSGYAQALARVRNESALAEGEQRKELVRLFHELSDVDDTTADVLLDWIESGETQRVEAAMPLLEQVPPDFVFARPDFVARALDAAFALGTPTGAGVSLALDDSLQPRVGFRGDEYARHLEWTRQRAEACAAQVASEHAIRFYRQIAESAASGARAHAHRDGSDDTEDDYELDY